MKNLQKKVEKFVKKYNFNHEPEINALDLVSEIGEVVKKILKTTNYGKEKPRYRQEIKNEVGDVFYSLINLSNHYNINLEEALDFVLEKYEKRLQKGSAGSE